jgi:hypothetical protein
VDQSRDCGTSWVFSLSESLHDPLHGSYGEDISKRNKNA